MGYLPSDDDDLLKRVDAFLADTPKTPSSPTANSKAEALRRAALKLGIDDPADLGAIISFETGGTFDPHKVGGEGNKYKGLIQFGPSEQKKYYNPKDTFETQVENGVVRYFQDRFKQAGKSTKGATLEDLYTTVIAGNPNANRNAKDAFGTSAKSGTQRILKEHRPKVIRNFFNGQETRIDDNAFWDGIRQTVGDTSAIDPQDDDAFWNETRQLVADQPTPATQPTPEAPSAFEAQLTVARDPKNMARSGVFFPNDGTNAALKYANSLDSNWALFPDKKHNGTHLINLAKAKKLKLRTPKEIQEFIDKNPNALKTLGIVVEDVGNATQGTAIQAKDPVTGTEFATGIVTNPVTAVEQAESYKKQFPNAQIEVTDSDTVTAERGEEVDRIYPRPQGTEADVSSPALEDAQFNTPLNKPVVRTTPPTAQTFAQLQPQTKPAAPLEAPTQEDDSVRAIDDDFTETITFDQKSDDVSNKEYFIQNLIPRIASRTGFDAADIEAELRNSDFDTLGQGLDSGTGLSDIAKDSNFTFRMTPEMAQALNDRAASRYALEQAKIKADADFEERKKSIDPNLSEADRDLEAFRLRGLADIDAGILDPAKQVEAYEKAKKDTEAWKNDRGFLGIWNQEEWADVQRFLGGRPDTINRPASESYQPSGLDESVKSPKDYFNKAYEDMRKQYGSVSNWANTQREFKERFKDKPFTYLMKTGEAGVGGVMKAPFKGASSALKSIAIGAEAIERGLGIESPEAEKKYSYVLAKSIEDLAEGIKIDKDFKGGNAELAGDIFGQVIIQTGLGIATGGAAAPAAFGAMQGLSEGYEEGTKEGLDGWMRLGKSLAAGLIEAPDYFIFEGMLKGGKAVNKISVVQNLKDSVWKGLIARGLKAPVAEKIAVAATDGFLAELIAKGGWKGTVGKVVEAGAKKAKIGGAEFFQESTTQPLNDLYAYITYDPSPERWAKATTPTKEIFVEGVAGFFGGIVGASLADIHARTQMLDVEGVKQAEALADKQKDVLPTETYNNIKTALKNRKAYFTKDAELKAQPSETQDKKGITSETKVSSQPAQVESESLVQSEPVEVQAETKVEPEKVATDAPADTRQDAINRYRGTERVDVGDIEGMSDLNSLREMKNEGKLQTGQVYEDGAGDLYKFDGNQLQLLEGLHAEYDYKSHKYVVTKRPSYASIREVPFYHGTAENVPTATQLKISPQNSQWGGSSQLKGVWFAEDPTEASGYGDTRATEKAGKRTQGQLLEARLDADDSAFVSLKEANKLYGEYTERATSPKSIEDFLLERGIKGVYRKTKSGRYDEIAVLDPSIIRDTPQANAPVVEKPSAFKQGKPKEVIAEGETEYSGVDDFFAEEAPVQKVVENVADPKAELKAQKAERAALVKLGYTVPVQKTLSAEQKADIVANGVRYEKPKQTKVTLESIGKEIAQFSSADEAFKAFEKRNDIPTDVAQAFLDKYGDNKNKSPKQAFEAFYNDVAPKTTTPKAGDTVTISEGDVITNGDKTGIYKEIEHNGKVHKRVWFSDSGSPLGNSIEYKEGNWKKGKPDLAMQAARTPGEWYSALGRALEQKMPTKASADQVRGILKDAKQEEREWLGIDQYLDENPTVTKADILQFIRDNQVQVEEVVKSEQKPEPIEWTTDKYGVLSSKGDGTTSFTLEKDGNQFALWTTTDGRGASHLVDSFDSLEEAKAAADAIIHHEDINNPTKFSQYVLPGGENYKELLLVMPVSMKHDSQTQRILDEARKVIRERRQEKGDSFATARETATILADPWEWGELWAEDVANRLGIRKDDIEWKPKTRQQSDYKSSHFDEPNILAHIRFDDRTVDGKKVLHIAEIQSDWHQAGRKQGYKTTELPTGWTIQETTDGWHIKDETGLFRSHGTTRAAAIKMIDGVPNAPFKKSWQELAFKKILRHAVENGYDAVSWDTGETQAERYDLSKQVKKIEIEVPSETNGTVQFVDIHPQSGDVISLEIEDGKVRDTGLNPEHQSFANKPLEDVVGKEMAEKILAVTPETQFETFEGNDLKVGGEGMKGFYDKILPTFANKYTKKWGGKVEASSVEGEHDASGNEPFESRDKALTVLNRGGEIYGIRQGQEELLSSAKELNEAESEDGQFDAFVLGDRQPSTPVHSLTITPAMRESVMKGQQMFRAVSELDAMGYAFANARKLPTKELIAKTNFAKNTRIVDNGVIAVDEIAEIELIRRVLDSPTQFYGAMAEPSHIADFNEKLDKMIAFTTEPKVKANLGKLKNLVNRASKHDGTVIFAMSEESVPEEKAHRALYGVRGDTQRTHQIAPDVMKSIQDAPVFKNAKQFHKDYAGRSVAEKVEEFAVKSSLGQWNDLGITDEQSKRDAIGLAIDFYESFAEQNKGKLTKEEIANKLATEIAYAQEYKDSQDRNNKKEIETADQDSPVESTKREKDRPDAEERKQGTDETGVELPKLESRTPGKSGVKFDAQKAEEAKAQGQKVAALSKQLGEEQYYTPQSESETDVKAQQLISKMGIASAIDQALYGEPSAEASRVLDWELERLSALAEAHKELGNDAEAAATMEYYADLIAGAAMRRIQTGREVQSYRRLGALTPVSAQLVAQKMKKLAFGDDAKLTPAQVREVEDLARSLQEATTQLEKSKIIIAEQQRIIDNANESDTKTPLNRQEALLNNYKKKEKIILAELEKRFPSSPMFKGNSPMAMAVKGNEVVLDAKTEGLLKDYSVGQILTNKSYESVIQEIQDISGVSLEQAKDIHAMAADEVRGASEPVSAEAKKRIQIRKEHYTEADKHAHPEKAAKKAVQLVEGNLKRQIETLQKEIDTKQKDVKTAQKVTSPEIEKLKRQRDALKAERDALLGTKLTDQEKIDRAIKATRKSIERTTEKIKAGDISVAKRESVTSDALKALRDEQKTLRSILGDMRREAKKTQTRASGLSKIAQQAVEFYPEDYELIAAINYLTQQKPKSINEAINYLQNTYGFNIVEAKEIAMQAKKGIDKIKASNKVAADKAKGIVEEERAKLDEAQTKATKESLKLNRFLKEFGQNPNAIKRFNNDFRAKLISNYGTQIFNAVQSATVTMLPTIALDILEAGFRAIGVNFGEATDIKPLDAFRIYAFLKGSNRQIAEQALAQFPEQYYEVHAGLMGDIDIKLQPLADEKTNKIAKGIHWWFDKNDNLNLKLAHWTGAKYQEMLFRNATVASTFDNIIRKRTNDKSSLESALKDGTFKDIITESDANRAAKRALEVTFASQIDDPVGQSLKRAYDKLDNYLPVLFNPVTYARFTYTATKVMVINPLTFGGFDQAIHALADKKNGTTNRPEYNTREIAKGTLAWSGVAVAYGVMSLLGGDDDKWYTIYPLGKDGPIWDVRRTYPLSSLFYVAHLIRSAKDGAPPPTVSDLATGLASLELDYFQYGPAANLYSEIGNAYSKQDVSKLPQAAATLGASYFSGLLRFFKPAKDILAQAWDKEAAVREYGDTASDKVIEQLSKSIPGVNALYNAPVKKDIRGNDVLMPFPLGRSFGINLVHPSFVSPEDSPATQWANKLWKFQGGGDMTAEERKAYNARKAIQNAWRTGNKIKVEEALKNMDATLTPKSKSRLIDELKYSELGAKVKYNFGDNAKDVAALKTVWARATDQEKAEIAKIIEGKNNISKATRDLFKWETKK